MNESVNQIAEKVGGTVIGDGSTQITGLNGIKEARHGDLSFLADLRYAPYLESTEASAILVPSGYEIPDKSLIQVQDPYKAFAFMLHECEKTTLIHPQGIHPSAVLDDDVSLGDNVALDAHVRVAQGAIIGNNAVIYAGAYIGRDTVIGDDTVIYANVSIRERIRIGKRCIIHSNVGIGGDGFGFSPVNGTHHKISQIGTVIIGDDVEIGSNSTIDRATCGQTIIGDGTKIDNHVVVGHNVHIGKHCTLSGGVAIAGSAVIGDHVTMGGMAGIRGHIEIGDHVTIGGGSGVMKSVPSGAVVSGLPSDDHSATLKTYMAIRRLPKLLRTVRALEKRLEQLENTDNG
ncbi:MAG: UDP-3-O-(3-hydroxymyristoyl)glucosamine N-acyltransferase [Candidatus Hydrogenedentes bacterium]|nr:UDP-3-O-(3-hydroxymyristoyl)glucosamine N-acyltransferase [Candidatus Hydrogenedentota bacterium]